MEENKLIQYIDFGSLKTNCDNYIEYQKVRSKEIYYFVSKWLSEYYKKDKIEYQVVNDWIKYDKSVKDTLYVFISTFEEYFKANLLEKISFKSNKFIKRDVDDGQEVNEEIWEKLNNWKDFIYSKLKRYESILKFFIEKYEALVLSINKTFTKSQIKRIISLRNKVMHFSFLVLPINNNQNQHLEIKDYLENFKREIESLKQLLPQNWDTSFKDSFNLCAKDSDENCKKTINKKIDKNLLVVI